MTKMFSLSSVARAGSPWGILIGIRVFYSSPVNGFLAWAGGSRDPRGFDGGNGGNCLRLLLPFPAGARVRWGTGETVRAYASRFPRGFDFKKTGMPYRTGRQPHEIHFDPRFPARRCLGSTPGTRGCNFGSNSPDALDMASTSARGTQCVFRRFPTASCILPPPPHKGVQCRERTPASPTRLFVRAAEGPLPVFLLKGYQNRS